jgi:hypothetical protein
MKTAIKCFVVVLALATGAFADTISQNFDNISSLPGAGWALVNNSAPIGATGWFQGNPGVFGAQSGSPDSYIAANFLNASAAGGNISNWLLTPEFSLAGGGLLTFYTRTEPGAPFADRLQVWLSTNGASTDVGSSDSSVGDFSVLLMTINPALAVGGYPEDWTAFTIVLPDTAGSGRVGFRYYVTDTTNNGDYIGIDSVEVTPVPEPSTLLLSSTAIGLLWRRLKKRVS